MVLRISGKNVDIGQALRSRIDETVGATVAKYFNGGFSGHVTVAKTGPEFETDCALHLDTGMVFEARGLDHDANLSFDQAAERLEKRLRRYKRRLKDHKPQRGHASEPPDLGDIRSYVVAAPSDDEIADDYAPTIVAETWMDLPTFSVSVAVMELDRTEAPVVIFRNSRHGGVNVVYRRPDGHFGWVDPTLTERDSARR